MHTYINMCQYPYKPIPVYTIPRAIGFLESTLIMAQLGTLTACGDSALVVAVGTLRRLLGCSMEEVNWFASGLSMAIYGPVLQCDGPFD